MTFSIVARDAGGAFGAVICSSSPAVAARCVHLADGVGGVNSQNITDPRLGPVLLERLRRGDPAPDALRALTEETENIAFRQLLVVDAAGRAAAYSGEHALGVFGHAIGDGVVAGGNLLASAAIPQLMVDRFEDSEGDLELRLLAAAQAAMQAGGEAGPVHSAGLSVVRDAGWRVTDLRVDWTDGDPIAELAGLLEVWLPQRDDYVNRGLNPSAAPTYGVPGDE
ncbi:hypothetical protein MLP_08410 [Microlunatus phosphovorus NM-1]|uniref:Fimbrial assembly protein FimA n=1 Tax=Microlunatus phosphovorus (strain ATCC 700054 / DSM 10555 / JCM 9379 / NBRC 101784 / NCIMB 13414 / VKM Ac-1990 / NM-1) TaxID=1032480 RepID=F5XLX6_MICPN|nr:DUF1028 domain-containing protein [Microlunatus phosphovorus]BAK33855.1 hypothetical protein MLP_08410 [Microlunatus phosphovorus NM-1]